MCYNCGCQMPDNDMGNPKNITNKTFNEASKAAGQSAEEAKKNTLDLLQKTLGEGQEHPRRRRSDRPALRCNEGRASRRSKIRACAWILQSPLGSDS